MDSARICSNRDPGGNGENRSSPERDDNLFATVEKNAREFARISLGRYRSCDLVHVRIWAMLRDSDDDLIPTNSGLSLRVEKLPELIASLQLAERRAADEAC